MSVIVSPIVMSSNPGHADDVLPAASSLIVALLQAVERQ